MGAGRDDGEAGGQQTIPNLAQAAAVGVRAGFDPDDLASLRGECEELIEGRGRVLHLAWPRIREQVPDADQQAFALGLYDGALARQADIDTRISAAADNWRLERIAVLDRNAIRLGAYELLHADTPAAFAARYPPAQRVADHLMTEADSHQWRTGSVEVAH